MYQGYQGYQRFQGHQAYPGYQGYNGYQNLAFNEQTEVNHISPATMKPVTLPAPIKFAEDDSANEGTN